jgi:hypothetical protein
MTAILEWAMTLNEQLTPGGRAAVEIPPFEQQLRKLCKQVNDLYR